MQFAITEKKYANVLNNIFTKVWFGFYANLIILFFYLLVKYKTLSLKLYKTLLSTTLLPQQYKLIACGQLYRSISKGCQEPRRGCVVKRLMEAK